MITTAFVWILTYAVHSTILILSVWALLKLFPRVPLRLQESLWRVALFGGLVTATVSYGADIEPLGGRLPLPAGMMASGEAVPAAAPPPRRSCNERSFNTTPAMFASPRCKRPNRSRWPRRQHLACRPSGRGSSSAWQVLARCLLSLDSALPPAGTRPSCKGAAT